MRFSIVLSGAVIGFLGAIGIVYDLTEPYKGFIVSGGTLGGVVLAVLISAVVRGGTSLAASLAWGGALGLVHSSVIFLAKGGWASMDAPYVVPTGVVSGIVLGPLVRWLQRARS